MKDLRYNRTFCLVNPYSIFLLNSIDNYSVADLDSEILGGPLLHFHAFLVNFWPNNMLVPPSRVGPSPVQNPRSASVIGSCHVAHLRMSFFFICS